MYELEETKIVVNLLQSFVAYHQLYGPDNINNKSQHSTS